MAAALQSVPMVFCDGAGVILGARLLGESPPPERFGYAEWLWDLLAFGEKHRLSFFFLGGKPGIAEKAASRVGERYPELRVDAAHGYFDHRYGSSESLAVVDRINTFRPAVLIVAFGMPRQERWIIEHWRDLDAGVGLTGGACFDYLSGNLKRPPAVLCNNGLEWLGRMIAQPKHLAGRYLRENPTFLAACIARRLSPNASSPRHPHDEHLQQSVMREMLAVDITAPYR